MTRTSRTEFDFDGWRHLAEHDPNAFERRRREAVERVIQRAPEPKRQRLRALQWRIEQLRRRSTPLGACVQLTRMMWDSVTGERGLMEALQGRTGPPAAERAAQILPWRAPRRP